MGAFFGSIAAISIGLSELYGRRTIARTSVLTLVFLLQAVGVVVTVASLAVVDGEPIGIDLVWGALSGIGMAVGIGFYFLALTRSSSAVVSPTVATLSAVIPYCYAVLRGEDASGIAVVGAAIAFAGLALIALGTGEVTALKQGLFWGTLSGLGYAFTNSIIVEVSDESGAWAGVAQRGAATVVLGIAVVVAGAQMVPPREVRGSTLAAGAMVGLTTVAILLGMQHNAPQTIVTTSMFPMVSVIVGYLKLGDPVARRQVVGIGLALLGIALVVVG